ncbi:MAG TPA: RNA polymerase sigma factor [Candidatus Dormibacteraeota bacterium]|nr:RNA polymerase sigma factor [Candidatus Dormibacteraeota bacterium]
MRLLYEQESEAVFRTICAIVLDRATAQDLTQEVFIRALRSWDGFDGRNAHGWLLKIGSNLAISHYRSEKRHRAVPPWLLITRRRDQSPEEFDDKDLVSWLMRPLNADQRARVVLHYYNQSPRSDIADMLGIPIGTVGSRLNKAMELMRQRAEVANAFPSRSAS